jgi:methyltransferase (TIGR00027 family)
MERAAHEALDSPLVLVDPLAVRMLSPAQAAGLRERPDQHDASPITRPMRALVVVRSRIAEDEIAHAARDRGVGQYVLLGAGLDTFAYRNPLPGVRVFEVDDPATQRLKHERLAAAGIAIPDTVTFVPCDFASSAPIVELRSAGFDDERPAVFAWLGVAMYLSRADVMRTLRAIAALPNRTAVVFDYALPPRALPWMTRLFYRRVLRRLEAQGEPWLSFFEPGPLRATLADLGFTEIDDLGAAEIDDRYLAGRRDGLKSGSIGRIVVARRSP